MSGIELYGIRSDFHVSIEPKALGRELAEHPEQAAAVLIGMFETIDQHARENGEFPNNLTVGYAEDVAEALAKDRQRTNVLMMLRIICKETATSIIAKKLGEG